MKKLTSFWQLCKSIFNFLYTLMVDFYMNNGLMRASSLAYTIILSFVPFCIVSIGILRFFPVFRDITQEASSRLVYYLTPAFGEILNQAFNLFKTQAEKLSLISVGFLCVTAVVMLLTIENHVNEMWQVEKNRSIGMSLLVSWGLMLGSPLLLGASIILSTYLVSISWLRATITPGLTIVPYLLSITAFTMLYKVIPAKKVRFKSALLGGVSAGIMFELAKKIFVIYIAHFASESILYGAFAVIPLLLLWLYICAIIFLFNAKLVQQLNVKNIKKIIL